MNNYDIYVNGKWIPSTSKNRIEVINPMTEQAIATVPDGTKEDVDAAVAAARKAFPAWSSKTPQERAEYLVKANNLLKERSAEYAQTVTDELGSPIKISNMVHMGTPIGTLKTYAKLADEFEWEKEVNNSIIAHEPIGVVGAITPWNYPLHQVTAKTAPALLAGNTIVLKPSELAPLSAYNLAKVFDEIGLPEGVFNVVSGRGEVVGDAMSSHPDIDMISFTGSGRAGTAIAKNAADTIKRVALELGGKSASVIMDDFDDEGFAKAVKSTVNQCFTNGGQRCTAFSRMLVPAAKYDQALEFAKAAAEKHAPGDPNDESTRLGPMVSEAQRDRVRGFIDRAVADGATIVTGGSEAPEGLHKGYFVKPTVLAGAKEDSEVAQDEVFGPVITVFPYDDIDDAVRLANNTKYGLAAGVYGADADKSLAVARRLRAGQVDINDGRWNFMAPFGGYKQSGNGRELGTEGLIEFLETKAMQR